MWLLPAAWTPSLYRRVCALMLFTTSRSVVMTVSKKAPQSDLVSCSVLKHCLMTMPISCVVFLQKAAGFFFGARGKGRVLLRFPCTAALNHVLQPPSETGVPSGTAGTMRRCSNRQTYRRWLGQMDCNGMIIYPSTEYLCRINSGKNCSCITK